MCLYLMVRISGKHLDDGIQQIAERGKRLNSGVI